jgi:hypothetical protein
LLPTGATRRRANPKQTQSICRRVESTRSCGAEETQEARKSLGSLHSSADRETPILSPAAGFCFPSVQLGGELTLSICNRFAEGLSRQGRAVLRKRRRREKVGAPSTRNSHPLACSECLFPTGATRRRANPKHMQSICRRAELTGSCGAEETQEARKSWGSLHSSADRPPDACPRANFSSAWLKTRW